MHTAAVTLNNYYKSFVSISGAFAAATGLGPLFSTVPTPALSYLFPPLGDVAVPARLGLVVLAATMTYLAFHSSGERNKVVMRGLFGISVLAACCYLIAYMQFVRKIDIPSANSTIHVSVGYSRTPFAERTFDGASDWDILRARGTSDEEIFKLWTEESVVVARLCLFASFCGFILPLVLIFSLGVRNQM
jgi:hypothetical protein